MSNQTTKTPLFHVTAFFLGKHGMLYPTCYTMDSHDRKDTPAPITKEEASALAERLHADHKTWESTPRNERPQKIEITQSR